jgi:hypothetical protein
VAEWTDELMAIESLYWKEELARIAKAIRPIAKPKRFSERAVCTVERDVMIGCFIVRRMIELKKVSSHVAQSELDVLSAPTVKAVNKLNQFSIDKNYDWGAEKTVKKSVIYICNQCIHAYVSFIERGPDRNWSHLLVVSDYDRKDVIWRIPFTEIIRIFNSASNDWPVTLEMEFDKKIDDYQIKTN